MSNAALIGMLAIIILIAPEVSKIITCLVKGE